MIKKTGEEGTPPTTKTAPSLIDLTDPLDYFLTT